MSKIVVIGSTNVDLIARVAHLPLPGETVGDAVFMQANGGKGANQAVAAARLGGDVIFVTCLGNDANGVALRNQFADDGIDTSSIITTDDAPTGTALIFVSHDGENCIAVAPGANYRLTPEVVASKEECIATAEYVLLQNEIPSESVALAIEKAHAAGAKAVLNPAPAMAVADALLAKLYMITPNETEAETLTGIAIHTTADAVRAADALLAKGVQNVIITLGSKGALVKNSEIEQVVPAFRVEAVDTTAAGDVFNGALLVALSEGKALTNAVRFAARCSAVAVTRMGAQTSIPWRKEIDALLQ